MIFLHERQTTSVYTELYNLINYNIVIKFSISKISNKILYNYYVSLRLAARVPFHYAFRATFRCE